MIFFIVAMANLEDNLNKITLVATGDGRIIVGELIIFFFVYNDCVFNVYNFYTSDVGCGSFPFFVFSLFITERT